MKFGVREICDVVFKAKRSGSLGKYNYTKGQPVLYIDSAKTSTIEGAATTVYAQGGKGNARLIAWEGEKTLTFTVEDALLSERGLAILTGAGLFNRTGASSNYTCFHFAKDAFMSLSSSNLNIEDNGLISNNCLVELSIDMSLALKERIEQDQPCYVLGKDSFEKFYSFPVGIFKVSSSRRTLQSIDGLTFEQLPKYLKEYCQKIVDTEKRWDEENEIWVLDNPVEILESNFPVFVDYYTKKLKLNDFIIDASNFAGYYYVEATTNFRRQIDGKDLKAMITFPNVKIQSNFTFSMAATGDPSTFTFTMDAMPGYTLNNPNKKVLCEMKIVDEDISIDNNISDNDSLGEWINAEVDVEYTTNNIFKIKDYVTLDSTLHNQEINILSSIIVALSNTEDSSSYDGELMTDFRIKYELVNREWLESGTAQYIYRQNIIDVRHLGFSNGVISGTGTEMNSACEINGNTFKFIKGAMVSATTGDPNNPLYMYILEKPITFKDKENANKFSVFEVE